MLERLQGSPLSQGMARDLEKYQVLLQREIAGRELKPLPSFSDIGFRKQWR